MMRLNDTSLSRLIKNINNLKESKIEVTPFSLEEVHKILTTVREDFRPYYTIRFLRVCVPVKSMVCNGKYRLTTS